MSDIVPTEQELQAAKAVAENYSKYMTVIALLVAVCLSGLLGCRARQETHYEVEPAPNWKWYVTLVDSHGRHRSTPMSYDEAQWLIATGMGMRENELYRP